MNQARVKVRTEKSAAEQIASDPRPIMIVDTCNFGNIVGLALSGKSKMILDVLRCLQDGITNKMFYLVVPQQVYVEFMRPGQFTDVAIHELAGPIQHWNSAVQTYNSICKSSNLLTTKNCYSEFDIEKAKQLYSELVEISKRFLCDAIIIKASTRAQKWAREREIYRKRPAKQGKDSFGDCEICGTTLSFLRTLRELKFLELAYFVSENKADFAFQEQLHPDLQPDFARVSLAYCQTITQAYGEIWTQHIKAVRGVKS